MMIDDKYLRILAAVYSLSNEHPDRPAVMSNQVATIVGIDHEHMLPSLRYLEDSNLLRASWAGNVAALLMLTAEGTDYVERPLDILRSTERPLTQANTINVGGDFNAIESNIVQMNASTISETDADIVRGSFDTILEQLPPDLVASQDLQKSRDALDTKLQASDRLGAAGVISNLAKIIGMAKDSVVLVQTLPIIYHGIRLLFHLP